MVPDAQGRLTVPSVVSFGDTIDQVFVGHAAVERQSKHARETVYDAKRLINQSAINQSIFLDSSAVNSPEVTTLNLFVRQRGIRLRLLSMRQIMHNSPSIFG